MSADVLALTFFKVPDIAGAREVYGLDGLEARDVLKVLEHHHRDQGLPPDLTRIAACALTWMGKNRSGADVVADRGGGEQQMLDRLIVRLCRWEGVVLLESSFDWLHLRQRCILRRLKAPCLWHMEPICEIEAMGLDRDSAHRLAQRLGDDPVEDMDQRGAEDLWFNGKRGPVINGLRQRSHNLLTLNLNQQHAAGALTGHTFREMSIRLEETRFSRV
ncbi:MAG: hypothetical protein ACPGU7_06725 [Gammaproteobacteria bacterium]